MQTQYLTPEELAETPKTQVITDQKHPVYTREVGNLTLINVQYWVTKTDVTKIFQSANLLRQGFEVYNNGTVKVYIGNTSDVALLKKIGRPIEVKTGFSSALYQGDLYIVADDTAAGQIDVRVWEEQL